MPALTINPQRLKQDFETLSRIGATGDGGVHRPSFSDSHLDARKWFQARAIRAGLDVRVDAAGNHSAFLARPGATRTLLMGSHLDSVFYGGRYDGALGVLAALEVLEVVKEAGLALPVNLEAIDFTDEEGSLVGLLGSGALAGSLNPEMLSNPRGGREAFEAGLQRAGLNEDRLVEAYRNPKTLAGFLELHVEQGPRLEQQGLDIGIVTGIVGSRWAELTFIGEANHAGTTPMADRHDAARGACAFVADVPRIVMSEFPECVATVGIMRLEPGAFNIIPGRAVLSLEHRSINPVHLKELGERLLEQARSTARRYGLELEVKMFGAMEPTLMDPTVRKIIAENAQVLGLSCTELHSGAGHDAESLAPIIPTGMIFIPSVDGLSHGPKEYSKWQDCVNGANLLLNTAVTLARGL